MLVSNGRIGRLSPDGRWLAYESVESGLPEIFVVAADGGQGKWEVSPNGAQLPRWSHDGKELLYFDVPASNIVSVSVKGCWRRSATRISSDSRPALDHPHHTLLRHFQRRPETFAGTPLPAGEPVRHHHHRLPRSPEEIKSMAKELRI